MIHSCACAERTYSLKLWLYANSLPFCLSLTASSFIQEPGVICLPVLSRASNATIFWYPLCTCNYEALLITLPLQGFEKSHGLLSWDVMRLCDGTQLVKVLQGWPQWHHSKWCMTNRQHASRDPRNNLRQTRTRAILARTPTRCPFYPIFCHQQRQAGLSERCQMHSMYHQNGKLLSVR